MKEVVVTELRTLIPSNPRMIGNSDLRLEEHIARCLSEGDLDLQDGVVRFVFVLIVALQEVLALGLPRPRILCQVQLHKPKLCVRM